MEPPTKEEIWRESIHAELVELAEATQRQADENQRYFGYFNLALYEIKQRILVGNAAICVLLGLILWRVW